MRGHGASLVGSAFGLSRGEHRRAFLGAAGMQQSVLTPMQGDASTRRYFHVRHDGKDMVLMDAPNGPDGVPLKGGKPYSAMVHLAEDCYPFIALAAWLRSLGLQAPKIIAQDCAAGFILMEMLHGTVYADIPVSKHPLYARALQCLLVVQNAPLPPYLAVPGASEKGREKYQLSCYDTSVFCHEVSLLADWYVSAHEPQDLSATARKDYASIWHGVVRHLDRSHDVVVLRDYHASNLIWMPQKNGLSAVGHLDFQDAVIGPKAYDVASLLQDARRDISPAQEKAFLTYYMQQARAQWPHFDEDAFLKDYVIVATQRCSKILGIFARLAKRDGKHMYLQHIPRVQKLLRRNLAHACLADLYAWHCQNTPGIFLE